MSENGKALAVVPEVLPPEILEKILDNDLSRLTKAEIRVFYLTTCASLGLNPITRPFEFLRLNGNKLTMYATKNCGDQLRQIHNVSLNIVARERLGDVYVVTSRAKKSNGREDEATGVVAIGHLKGDQLANAMMKAETKSKRRVSLSICGLSFIDESEIESIAGAVRLSREEVEGDGDATPTKPATVRAVQPAIAAPPQPPQFEEAPELPLSVEEQAAEQVDAHYSAFPSTEQRSGGIRLTRKQIGAILTIARGADWPEPKVRQWVQAKYSVELVPGALDYKSTQEVFNFLKEQAAKRRMQPELN